MTSPAPDTAANDTNDADAVVEDAGVVRSSAGLIVSALLSKHSHDRTTANVQLSNGCKNNRTIKGGLWPWFLRRALLLSAAVNDNATHKGGEDTVFVLTILSNQRGSGRSLSFLLLGDEGGGGGGDPQLRFVVDSYDYSGNGRRKCLSRAL